MSPAHRFKPGHVTKVTPATQWVKAQLEDGEWHDYRELTEKLLATGLVPNWEIGKSHGAWHSAQSVIKGVGRRNSYEMKSELIGGRRLYTAIRKTSTPVNGVMRTCSNCGRSNLPRAKRVRRVVEYRSGDKTLARVSSEAWCIPCAEAELETVGRTWYKDKEP